LPCSPCSLLSPALAANGRVALVVGNGAYRTVPALLNPVRDADAVARTLGEAGFEVLLATDLDLASLRERIYAFAAKVEAGGAEGTAVLFFAGHAVQLNGTNYLLPVDAQLMAAKDAPAQALALSDILKRLDSTRAGTKIVILDACRDNPFPSGSETGRGLALVGGTGGEGEAGEAGLARIESKGGTLVAFSTSPGATASDGEGASSPYAGALLDHMGESGLAVEAVFRRVRVAVQQATNREQTPWETSSLTREFTFFGAGPDPSAGAASSSFSRRAFEVSATRGVLARRSVDEAYEIAVHADTIEGYRAFLDVYSDDARAGPAAPSDGPAAPGGDGLDRSRAGGRRREPCGLWPDVPRLAPHSGGQAAARVGPGAGGRPDSLPRLPRPSRRPAGTAAAARADPAAPRSPRARAGG
jgi:uncharacterized caspase-like protein